VGEGAGYGAEGSAGAGRGGVGIREQCAEPLEQRVNFAGLKHALLNLQRRRPGRRQRRIGLDPLLQRLLGIVSPGIGRHAFDRLYGVSGWLFQSWRRRSSGWAIRLAIHCHLLPPAPAPRESGSEGVW
jgi:hypothetical protein